MLEKVENRDLEKLRNLFKYALGVSCNYRFYQHWIKVPIRAL